MKHMRCSNFKMEIMLAALKPILEKVGEVGYVAARNTRFLNNSLIEYIKFKNDLIRKYGEDDLDENGKSKGTISVNKNSPNFDAFFKEINEIGTIEHEIEIMTLKYEDVKNVLSGNEILSIYWMLED